MYLVVTENLMPRVSKGTRTNRKLKAETLPQRFQPGFKGELDGRTLLARALQQRFSAIASDLGGEQELSSLKSSLLERLVWLEATLVKIESGLASTTDAKSASEAVARWIQGCNALLGIAKTLGLERSRRNPWELLDAQRERFAILAPSLLALARGDSPPIGRFWLECVKGWSKTSDVSGRAESPLSWYGGLTG